MHNVTEIVKVGIVVFVFGMFALLAITPFFFKNH